MTFRFNERKAAQAAAYLLRKRGGTWSYGQLIKLLYLADRQKILDRGAPITGDRLVSMQHGTALSLIYEVIRDGPSEDLGRVWAEYVSAPRDYQVQALKNETDELSRYELRVLDDIDRQFGSMSFSQLRNYTHQLPEWEDPGQSSRTIPPERILRVSGRPQEEIDLAKEKAETAWSIDSLPR
jgi:uncharacterized phage-associated protein